MNSASIQVRACVFCAVTGAWWSAVTCSPVEPPNGFTGTAPRVGSAGGTGVGSSAGGTPAGGQAAGGAATGGVICSPPTTTERPHPGVYDYKSCVDCHGSTYWGGWVYSNAAGDAWVADASVTLNGSDGTTVTLPTAKDGFFTVKPAETKLPSAFTPCVSKCSDRNCATKSHNSLDCQTAACHGGTNRSIYLAQNTGGIQNTGGTGSGASNCKPPTSGGPRAHDPSFDGQTCATCHDASYNGGYVYEGLTGTTPVSMATLTVTPTNGAPITAVTGPGGLFQIRGLQAPYIACVSKCPNTVCSASGTHPNTNDCSTCHNANLRIHLP